MNGMLDFIQNLFDIDLASSIPFGFNKVCAKKKKKPSTILVLSNNKELECNKHEIATSEIRSRSFTASVYISLLFLFNSSGNYFDRRIVKQRV